MRLLDQTFNQGRSSALLRLLDAQGRLVRTGAGARLSLVNLRPGVYVLQATVPGQPTRTARLMVE